MSLYALSIGLVNNGFTVTLDSFKQEGDGHFEPFGNLSDARKSYVAHTGLYRGVIGSVHADGVSERFLAHTQAVPQRLAPRPE